MAAAGIGATRARAAKSAKPNFLFILMDDMGWKDVAYNGNPFHETPNIDRLASEGMVFTDGYAPAPFCAPSRTSIMTGQTPARVYWKGLAELDDPGKEYRSQDWHKVCTEKQSWNPPDRYLLPEALADAGYATGHIGKWHVETWRERGPMDQGFADSSGGGCGVGAPKSHFLPYGIPDCEGGEPGEYLTDRVTDEAVGFLKQHRDRPFYLQVWHYTVHMPVQAKAEDVAIFREKGRRMAPDRNPTYAAMVKSADDSVGRLLDTLEELGLTDNTVVIFSSDNGGKVWEGCERLASNGPLRGEKGDLWEGGIREPLCVKWPGVVRPGSVCRTPVTLMDLYPTVIGMAEGRLADDQPLDGADLRPLLRGEDVLRNRPLFWYDPVYRIKKEEIGTPTAVVRLGDYKLMKSYHFGRSLYNLREDIGETTNLAGKLPEKTEALEKLVDGWMAETGVCPPFPNAAYDPKARISRAVEGFTPKGATLVHTWDLSKEAEAWRAARLCTVEHTGEAMRVNFAGSYPEIAGAQPGRGPGGFAGP